MNTIQATELRIGNLVYSYENKIQTIFGVLIENNFNKIFTDKDANLYFHIEGLKPIPLNEDWLVRFKWDCFQEGWYGLNKYGLGHEFTWNIYDGMLRWKGSAIDCKFVHQLQNIVHALKGTELILTDK